MLSFKIITVLLVASSVYSNPINLIEGIQKFLKEYAAGDAEKGMKALDPMIIKNLNYPEEALGINTNFPELTITGLKDAVVTEFSKNDEDVATLALTYSFDAEGPVHLEFPKKNRHLEGTIKYEADINAHVTYSVANEQIGPETITCEATNAKYTLDEKYIQVLKNDPLQCEDDACWKEGMKKFFKEFAAGDAEKGIKPMDPIVIENINVPEEALGLNTNFPKLTITGLKDVVANEYTRDKDDIIHLSLKLDFIANGPVNIQFPKKDKSLAGTIKYEGGVEYQIQYPLVIENGKPVIGQETVSCDAYHSQTVIDNNLIHLLETDIDTTGVKERFYQIHKEHEDRVVCTMADAVFKVVIENIRNFIKSEK